MKYLFFTFLCAVSIFRSQSSFSQHLNDALWYNNGANVTIQSGTLVTIQGDMTNRENSQPGTHLNHNGFLWIQGNLYGDNLFQQRGTGTIRLQNENVYTGEYQFISGGYAVRGGQSSIGVNDGSIFTLECANRTGHIYISNRDADVRNAVDFNPPAVTVENNAIPAAFTPNRILTFTPGPVPANGRDYTTTFGMMNNAAGMANYRNVSTNLLSNTIWVDNAYIQGKHRRAILSTISPGAGEYGFPIGLEPSMSGTAARGIQYCKFDFEPGTNGYDVVSGYFQQGSNNTVTPPGTMCTISDNFLFYGTFHGEWMFSSLAAASEPYTYTIYPQDYASADGRVQYFITKNNLYPNPGVQSCGTTPLGLSISGMTQFGNNPGEEVELDFGGNQRVLAVRFGRLQAAARNCNVHINFETQTEQNSDYFEIQWHNGNNNWATIATLDAAGNSTQIRYYTYQHMQAIEGVNHYRVKQVSMTGIIEYSQEAIARVNCGGSGIVVYPNPVKDKVTITLESGMGAVELRLINTIGQQVTGVINISGGSTRQIDMSALAKGVYILQTIQQNKIVQSIKLVKQ